MMLSTLTSSPLALFSAAILLRVILLFYGLWQDENSPLKYTDIDYFVFTDASRFVAQGRSPYDRDTYRYTPLLAWLLLPTTWSTIWFSFGKILFASADILAGWLIIRVLQMPSPIFPEGLPRGRALAFASLWLLNPMVATISTRGSSEGLLCVLVVALLWAVLRRKVTLAAFLLGFSVHFKIYPFIYAPSIVWWMDAEKLGGKEVPGDASLATKAVAFFNAPRVKLALVSLATFMALNAAMYLIYGFPFLQHTYFHHVTRIDHRHNFSPYNILLYLSSATPQSSFNFESVAFLPQLFLSAVALPLTLAKKDLPSTMLAQTFAFVTFNKVCTSQYFLWYLIFLPFYLPVSSLLARPKVGVTAGVLWVAAQGLWLQQGFELEFLGNSAFVPGLWVASLSFFLVNSWILGIIILDIGLNTATKAP